MWHMWLVIDVTCETIVGNSTFAKNFQVRTWHGPKNGRGCLVPGFDKIHSCRSLNCLSSSSEDFFTFRPIFLFSFQIIKIFIKCTMDCGVHSVDQAVDQTVDQTMVYTVDSSVVKSRLAKKKWFQIPGCVRIMAGIMDIEYFRIYQNCFNLFLFVFLDFWKRNAALNNTQGDT